MKRLLILLAASAVLCAPVAALAATLYSLDYGIGTVPPKNQTTDLGDFHDKFVCGECLIDTTQHCVYYHSMGNCPNCNNNEWFKETYIAGDYLVVVCNPVPCGSSNYKYKLIEVAALVNGLGTGNPPSMAGVFSFMIKPSELTAVPTATDIGSGNWSTYGNGQGGTGTDRITFTNESGSHKVFFYRGTTDVCGNIHYFKNYDAANTGIKLWAAVDPRSCTGAIGIYLTDSNSGTGTKLSGESNLRWPDADELPSDASEKPEMCGTDCCDCCCWQ